MQKPWLLQEARSTAVQLLAGLAEVQWALGFSFLVSAGRGFSGFGLRVSGFKAFRSSGSAASGFACEGAGLESKTLKDYCGLKSRHQTLNALHPKLSEAIHSGQQQMLTLKFLQPLFAFSYLCVVITSTIAMFFILFLLNY